MQRNNNGSSVSWTIASIPFHTAPGIGWRLHMSKISAEAGEREVKVVEVSV
jgi:hypothetical protein